MTFLLMGIFLFLMVVHIFLWGFEQASKAWTKGLLETGRVLGWRSEQKMGFFLFSMRNIESSSLEELFHVESSSLENKYFIKNLNIMPFLLNLFDNQSASAINIAV